ncbi:MAG TPA: ribose 5-phosphate isomerase B [Candidatus Diapherotrites archaeon]|uniref:Ribose 5-phosphate isomerase B n=1 Tax=Candidatus Iainarchaeum sp. TaxID=3101447 RepID=A0A7J4IYH0_9ARCH|nr:ribose 5-phosphate isomerase B [Candidatus Diapherotrites archaeon]
MKFYIGSDHAGFRTKETLKKRLAGMKVRIVDMGAFDEERSDYPDFAKKVSQAVVNDKGSFGLLVCGTGIGMCIAANKVRGVRAANPFDEYTAAVAREHNSANVICLGGRTYKASKAQRILDAFITSKPSREKRHRRRVEKICEMERR